MTKHQFPLVADGQPIIEAGRQMYLYENTDLITNIHGYYQDKNYEDIRHENELAFENQSESYQESNRKKIIDEGRNYAEMARKRAKRDIKAKRQDYIAKEMIYSPKPKYKSEKSAVSGKNSQMTSHPATALSHLSEKLSQESYILAEISTHYNEPKETNQPVAKKNNYDFLKRSQIYNNEETRIHREKTIAQELNLTRLEDVKN
ncbi:hypothetical protein [Streptococcus parauberis]|uniref:hypothetical protein n=1 Tax=Streptococcus parauberis TaxID=1348 RepID=UPI0002BB0A7D|nr:hypothetical protein [Streptococcus parauberis]EMF49213.1 hypothetical protein SPJ2_0033 [Streptococcus parauberis KRS-02109]PIA83847.1 hypothetical protein ADO07_01106 [Streptococcus parauberis]UWM87372.1 hypothetical protein N2A93_02260 [Streptococcus parauberis]UWM89344.1 hypothetical protein N2A96_02255 [Streptococcus parauberis]WEM60063.1 hypothetical protein P1T47_02310 [Streptococcus parauberis]